MFHLLESNSLRFAKLYDRRGLGRSLLGVPGSTGSWVGDGVSAAVADGVASGLELGDSDGEGEGVSEAVLFSAEPRPAI